MNCNVSSIYRSYWVVGWQDKGRWIVTCQVSSIYRSNWVVGGHDKGRWNVTCQVSSIYRSYWVVGWQDKGRWIVTCQVSSIYRSKWVDGGQDEGRWIITQVVTSSSKDCAWFCINCTFYVRLVTTMVLGICQAFNTFHSMDVMYSMTSKTLANTSSKTKAFFQG